MLIFLNDSIKRKRNIYELLERVTLQKQSRTKVRALSGGMKRRLGIVQALLHDPRVLIVDEPTAGLDPEERIRFRNLLTDLADGRIVILSTSKPSENAIPINPSIEDAYMKFIREGE